MKKRALIIDDEQVVLDSVSKILTAENYDVYTTLNAGAGISHAINDLFDIVLTDIRMPFIDGFKVIRDIRRFSKIRGAGNATRGDQLHRKTVHT